MLKLDVFFHSNITSAKSNWKKCICFSKVNLQKYADKQGKQEQDSNPPDFFKHPVY